MIAALMERPGTRKPELRLVPRTSLRIGLDMDGVIYDFASAWCKWVGIEPEPPTSWEFYEDRGFTKARYLETFREGVDAGFIFSTGKPIRGARAGIRRLRQAGHTIHIVTDRFIGSRSQINTAFWLQAWRIPFDSLTFAHDKTLVRTDAFLDDKPGNVDALRDEGCAAFLLNLGRKDQADHPFLIESFDQFEREVQKLC